MKAIIRLNTPTSRYHQGYDLHLQNGRYWDSYCGTLNAVDEQKIYVHGEVSDPNLTWSVPLSCERCFKELRKEIRESRISEQSNRQ